MPSPPATGLVAFLILVSAGALYAVERPSAPSRSSGGPAAETVLIIARPEASDLYVPPKVRISGDEILRRNPSLLRANESEPPYDLAAALQYVWRGLHPSSAPASLPDKPHPSSRLSVVAAPAGLALLPLVAFVFLGLRRPLPLGAEHPSTTEDHSAPPGASSPRESP